MMYRCTYKCYGGSIGWATGATFGIALADPKRKTILITGEGSHQLTANEIGNMGRYGANSIIFVLNNDGYRGTYIEVIGGRMDMPKDLAFAHIRLKELYGDTA